MRQLETNSLKLAVSQKTMLFKVLSGAAAALMVFGCASTSQRSVSGPRIRPEVRSFLLSPSAGFPRTLGPGAGQQLEAGYSSLVRDADFSAAMQAAGNLLQSNPALQPARVLQLQVEFAQGSPTARFADLDEMILLMPEYLAAQVLRARVSELAGDLPRAFELYWVAQDKHAPASRKVAELREAALTQTYQEALMGLNTGRVDLASQQVERLRLWAPRDAATLRARQGLAAAQQDMDAELQSLRDLEAVVPDDLAVILRRAELETIVGDAGFGLGVLQRLAAKNPGDLVLADMLGRAKFRWKLQVLPEAVRNLANSEELMRADFAALLFWLFPEVRYGQPAGARIANDILGHPFRNEIVKVANLGLIAVDPTLHRFDPDSILVRGTALRGLLSLLELNEQSPACLGDWSTRLTTSNEFVCAAAASCGLIPSPEDCLPESPVSGQVAIELGRLAQRQLSQ